MAKTTKHQTNPWLNMNDYYGVLRFDNNGYSHKLSFLFYIVKNI